MRPIRHEDFLNLATGDERGPVALAAAVELVKDPERWLSPVSEVRDLFRAWQSIIRREAEIDRVTQALQVGHKLPMAGQAVMSRVREVKDLPLLGEFEKLLRQRAADDGFNPFRLPTVESFAVETEPDGLDALATRREALRRLNETADVFHSYVSASGNSFWTVARQDLAEQAVEVLNRLREAIMSTGAALREAEAEASQAERVAAENRARQATQAAEEARAEAARAEQRAADARASAEAAGRDAAIAGMV